MAAKVANIGLKKPTNAVSSLRNAELFEHPLARVVRFRYGFTPIKAPYEGVQTFPKCFENPALLERQFVHNRELKVGVLCKLADKVAKIKGELPEARLLLEDASVKLPSYFARVDYETGSLQPIYFSVLFRDPAVEINRFSAQIDRFARSAPTLPALQGRLHLWTDALVQFLLHDYGHIADTNGGIDLRSGVSTRSLRVEKSKFARRFALTPEELEQISCVESDLRAEVFRKAVATSERNGQAWITNMFSQVGDRWQRDRFCTNRCGLIDLALWTTSAKQFGLSGLVRDVERALVAPLNANRLGDALLYWDLNRYLERYFRSHRYNRSWMRRPSLERVGMSRDRLVGF